MSQLSRPPLRIIAILLLGGILVGILGASTLTSFRRSTGPPSALSTPTPTSTVSADIQAYVNHVYIQEQLLKSIFRLKYRALQPEAAPEAMATYEAAVAGATSIAFNYYNMSPAAAATFDAHLAPEIATAEAK